MSNSQHVNQTKTPDSINSSFNQFHHNNSGNSNLSTNNGRNHNQAHYGHAAGESGSHHAENHRQNTSTPSSVASSVDNGSMKGKWRVCNFCCQNYVNWQLIEFTVYTGKLLDDPTTAANHFGQKRTVAFDPMNFGERQLKVKRTMNDTTTSDTDMNESIDNMNSDDIFNSHVMQPQVTINESPRFDVNAVKRESNDNSSLLQSQSPSQNFRTSHYREWKKSPRRDVNRFSDFFSYLAISSLSSLSRIIENPCTSNNAIQNPLAFGPYNFPSDFTSNETSSPASQNDSKINIHMDIPAGKLNLFSRINRKIVFLYDTMSGEVERSFNSLSSSPTRFN